MACLLQRTPKHQDMSMAQGTSRFFKRVKNRVGSGSNPTRFFWDNRVGLPDFNPFVDIVLTPYYLNRFIAVLT